MKYVATLGLLVVGLVGCGIQTTEDTSRIDQLNRENWELRNEFNKVVQEKSEVEKRMDRMVRCNKDFRGNMGQRLEKEVRLVRITQRVQRYNCNNQLVSDEKETVTSPRSMVELKELSLLSDKKFDVNIYNRKTCNRPDKGFFRGGGFFSASRHPYLMVNKSNTLLDHEVEPGLNEIDLSICPAGQGYCQNPTFVATLALNVIYEEQHKNEILSVQPTAEECSPPKNSP